MSGFSFAAPKFNTLLAAAKRFPLPTLATLVFAVLQIATIHNVFDEEVFNYAGFAAFFVTLTIALMGEERNWPQARVYLLSFFGLLALGAWCAGMGEQLGAPHTLLGFALLGFCVIAPLRGWQENDKLWQFVQRSFTGLGLAGIAVIVFQIGIFATTYALDQLFDLEREERFMMDASVLVFSVFWPLYTLTFVPKLPMQEETTPRLAPVLGFVLSYVALPVLLLYGAVIAVYGVQVVVLGQAPKGSVSWMIMGFAAAGILLHFLLYPMRETGAALVRLYHRFFFIVLLPYLALLFWAVMLRINEYGWTEMRFLAVVGGAWATGIALASLSRIRLALAPVSLVLLLLVASVVAEPIGFSSQSHRLEMLLTQLNLVQDGALVKEANASNTPWDTRRDLSSLLDYLLSRRDGREMSLLRRWENENYKPALPLTDMSATQFMSAWKMDYVGQWERERPSEKNDIYFSDYDILRDGVAVNISGYDYIKYISLSGGAETNVLLHEQSHAWLQENMLMVEDKRIGAVAKIDLLATIPQPFEERLEGLTETPTYSFVLGETKVRLLVDWLQVTRKAKGEPWMVKDVRGYLFLSNPPQPASP